MLPAPQSDGFYTGSACQRPEQSGIVAPSLPNDGRSLVIRKLIGNAAAAWPVAAGFTAHEKRVIAAWSVTLRRRGVRTGIVTGHEFFAEALHITLHPAAEPTWLVHKTPAGAVAVRLWPGLAKIVPTIAHALADIRAAIDSGGAEAAIQ